jgi:hypothetical protein
MVACAFARGCARVVVCVLAMGAVDVAAQEAVPAAEAGAAPSQQEAPDRPSASDAAQTEAKPEVKPQSAPATLPGMVVDAPKTATVKKAKGKSSSSAPAIAGPDPEPEVPGIVYGQALSDTGMTTFDARNVQMRTDGSGDTNTFLRNLPNVQYQNDTDTDAGVTPQRLIDTRPLELSINGARTYENNFILNGVSISSITGPVEGGGFTTDLEADGTPNLNSVYGQHSQTVFVPSEFIGTATLIDSNASAEYGQFQGGVVLYDLARPPTDRYRASVTYSRLSDDQVNYLLATPTGTNPLGRVAPSFTKENLAASVGAPITNELSFILQASRKQADTLRQKEYRYYDGFVTEDSENIFLRLATALKTDIGRFTLDTSVTDYSQLWQSYSWRDMEMDVTTKSSTTQLEYFTALSKVVAPGIGLENVSLKSRAFYNDANTGNYTNSDTAFARIAQRRKNSFGAGWVETFATDDYTDWCRSDPESTLPVNPSRDLSDNTVCYEGGYGNKETGQTDVGLQAQLRGNLLLGRFLLGGEVKSVEGRRARLSDFVYYSTYATASGDTAARTPPSGEYDCDPNDESCSEDQFARVKIVSSAFDISQTVNAAHGYAEIDQTLGWFNVRAGTRVDYEDYLKNLNVAPRLAATITPIDGLSFTGGYNRYYIGETLYYALRDSQPFSLSWTRNLIAGTDTPGAWVPPTTIRRYGFKSSDLETPFTDEYTGAVRVRDPFLGGSLRIRYLERYGRDQFATESCGSNCYALSNDAENFYRSASTEYVKFWRTPSIAYLSGAGFSVGATWSEQSMSNTTYVDDDESDEYIWYKEQSYTREAFNAVTGNLDIPVRIGATLSTTWFSDRLWLGVSANYNLGYNGVYDTGRNEDHNGRQHDVYEDRKFDPVALIDLEAELMITEQAYISAHVNNVFNTAGNKVSSNDNPWVLGRTVWLESGLRF